MQLNNKFFKGARSARIIGGGALLAIVGLFFAGLGVFFLIKPSENLRVGVCIGFIALGLVAAVVGIIMIIVGVKNLKKMKPLSEAEVKANEEKFASEGAKVYTVKDQKLYFHFGGKMNQSFFVETPERKTIYECRLVKFNPFLADTFEFANLENGTSKTFKMGKPLTSESEGFTLTGSATISRFKINGVMCWDYLRDRGYEVKSLLGESKTIVSYELVKLGKKVARILPANTKDPFNERVYNPIRVGYGQFLIEVEEGNLEDIIMATFIINKVGFVE